MALGMGAYTAAMFHVTTHAFFKALLFLSAGSVIHGMGGEQDIRKMGGLRRHMPITFWVFSVGTLAISGFPFLSGFFSKDEIFAFTYAHGGAAWWILASLGALLTAVYMCRLWYVTFFGTFRGTTDQEHHLHESPLVMTIPLMALAFLSVVGGLLNTPHLFHFGEAQWLSHWMAGNGILGVPVIPVQVMHLDHQTEWMLMAITTTVALLVLVLLYRVYRSPRNLPVEDAAQGRLSRMIAGKFYIDELYEFLFVRTTERLSRILHYYADIWAIDGLVQLVGSGVEKMGGQFRRLQNGNTAFYLVGMVLGVVGLMLTVYIL
jgi:NADH-quinone oxidoreductase subunit L